MSTHRARTFALAVIAAFALFLLSMLSPRLAEADNENGPVHEPHGGSWVSISAFADHRALGNHELGAMATVGLALDRAGTVLAPASLTTTADATQDRSAGIGVTVSSADSTISRTVAKLPITREIARQVVVAAWRASGVGADDERLDSMITRARISAILPETRLRAMRRITDQLDEPPPTSSSYFSPDSVDTWLEARFTWRLDRLLFVDEEPSVEHLRLDRVEARVRIATRVLAAASDWQRAWVDLHTISPDAPASLDASLRIADAEASLDVLTGGWFSRWRSRVSP